MLFGKRKRIVKRILIVEDEPLTAFDTETMLADFGYEVVATLESGWLTGRQIEAGRMCASQFMQREGRVYIRVFPHKPVSGKPLETRMGKGKGEPEFYVAVIKEGAMLFEIGGVTEDIAIWVN